MYVFLYDVCLPDKMHIMATKKEATEMGFC